MAEVSAHINLPLELENVKNPILRAEVNMVSVGSKVFQGYKVMSFDN